MFLIIFHFCVTVNTLGGSAGRELCFTLLRVLVLLSGGWTRCSRGCIFLTVIHNYRINIFFFSKAHTTNTLARAFETGWLLWFLLSLLYWRASVVFPFNMVLQTTGLNNVSTFCQHRRDGTTLSKVVGHFMDWVAHAMATKKNRNGPFSGSQDAESLNATKATLLAADVTSSTEPPFHTKCPRERLPNISPCGGGR